MINSTDTDNSGLIVTEIDLLQTERFVVLEINRGLSPVFFYEQIYGMTLCPRLKFHKIRHLSNLV